MMRSEFLKQHSPKVLKIVEFNESVNAFVLHDHLDLTEINLSALAEINYGWDLWQHRQTEVDELQKRVDAAKYYMKNIFSGDAEVDQCHLGDLLDILDGKIVDELEQALKGGEESKPSDKNKPA